MDVNVTRNVRAELLRHDWDVMILHYCGLDHIGHLLGPHSFLVSEKLRYFDLIVEDVYSYLQSTAGKSLLVLLGDHGMTVRKFICLMQNFYCRFQILCCYSRMPAVMVVLPPSKLIRP